MSTVNFILAGIFAIPPILITVATVPIIGILSVPSMALLLTKKYVLSDNKKNHTTENVVTKGDVVEPTESSDTNNNKVTSTTATDTETKHKMKQVIITGGSSGIGLAIGKEAARRHDVNRIVLLARDVAKLETAKTIILSEIRSSRKMKECVDDTIQVDIYSIDVRDADAVKDVAQKIMMMKAPDSEETVARTTHLFCCAGVPYPLHHEDITSDMYTNAVAVNQLGSICTCNAFLYYMKQDHRKHDGGGGTITFCTSVCGLIGVYGYAAYCPTKYALRGYAECLYIELLPYRNIHIQVAFPPDTDTPGYAEENKTKPVETQLISDTTGLHTANHVGNKMYCEAIDYPVPKFYVSFTFDGWLLCLLNSGFTPFHTILDGVAQVTLIPLTRWIGMFLYYQWNIVISSYQNKDKTEQLQIEKKLFPERFVNSSTNTTTAAAASDIKNY